jgi:hypothetical protein
MQVDAMPQFVCSAGFALFFIAAKLSCAGAFAFGFPAFDRCWVLSLSPWHKFVCLYLVCTFQGGAAQIPCTYLSVSFGMEFRTNNSKA